MNERRRNLWEGLSRGFTLAKTTRKDVEAAQGKPAQELAEDHVLVLEYEAASSAAPTGGGKGALELGFSKTQFIFYDGALVNLSYVEPTRTVTREEVEKLLGKPDEIEDGGEDGEGPTDIFDVDSNAEAPLSFSAHFGPDETLEALSLCAEVEGDLEEE